jgi:hypothetical protein
VLEKIAAMPDPYRAPWASGSIHNHVQRAEPLAEIVVRYACVRQGWQGRVLLPPPGTFLMRGT